MKKFLITLIVLILCSTQTFAKNIKGSLIDIINQSDINKNSVSISVKSVDSGKTMYALNDKILMHPASVQKILTLPAIIEALGEDYEFSTKIYSCTASEYLIELGADPYFSTSDLRKLVHEINAKEVKQIYIDDNILENKDWGEGWQWDDDLNNSMPRFNSYNMDKNIIKITVMPPKEGKKSFIINPSKYPLIFMNNLSSGDTNNIKISRDNSISSNTISLSGTIKSPANISFPNNNLKRYFDIKLTQALGDRNIYLKTPYSFKQAGNKDSLLLEITHPISRAVSDILINSNNMIIETLSKIAGAKIYGKSGTDEKGLRLINEYYRKKGINASRIRLADTSGVSKNNLVDADFVTEFLVKSKDNKTVQLMASPGQGTLASRMMLIGENLKAKTGTLADISSLAGYITSKNGNKYAFCIIINDPKSTNSDKKSLEDYLVREMYLKL